jgi:uncharacterized membrane protein
MSLNKTLLRFYLWGTLGLSTEIFFTAAVAFYHSVKDHTSIDWGFKGQSYIWMFFIYGVGAILFPLVHKHLKGFQLILRIFLIALGIFVVEFITGFILDKVTGHCPWQYTNRWNIMGYIRLDYLPAWMGFGYLIERADELFEKMSGTLID